MGGIHWLLYVCLLSPHGRDTSVTVCFFCSVKLFSAVAGPIGTKFGMRHELDASQVLRDCGGATPGDGDFDPFWGP